MRKVTESIFTVLLIFISVAALCEPVSAASVTKLDGYVKALQAVILDDVPILARQRDWLVKYYSGVKVVKTIEKNGYIVDCVPFSQQPGLFGVDQATMNAAIRADAQQRTGARNLNADFDVSQCPNGTVAVIRPQLAAFQHKQLLSFIKQAGKSAGKPVSGYQYVELLYNFKSINYASTNNVWIALGGNTAPVMAPSASSHTLNQLWWLTTNGATSVTNSLETGWITSSYFTSTMQTTIFAFSTTDGYAGGSSDWYNAAGGFVQYSSSPIVLGTPVANVSYVFVYSKMKQGYELDLYPINSDGFLGTCIPVGYYPYSRYANGANENFSHFGGGAELFVQQGVRADLSGTMYGVGTNFNNSLDTSWTMLMSSTNKDYSYSKEKLFGRTAVVFSGSNVQ